MRAIVVKSHGGPEVLEQGSLDDPSPGPGEVLVDVIASGVNFIDVYHRTGRYPTVPPFVPGCEGAGTVAAVGEGVTAPAPGELVAWAGGLSGSYAERVVLSADHVVPVPSGVNPEIAAAVLLQGMTAHYLTHSTYAIQPGDTALVHAAAGGMGLLLTQVVKLRGGRVIGTVSTADKEKLAREAGADEVIRYTETDFTTEVRRLLPEGVAAVYDGVGATTFDGSLGSLRRRGTLALYGAASGPVPPFDPLRLQQAGSLFLTRPNLAHYTATRDELLERAGDVLRWTAAGELRVHVGHRYPLEQARVAHEDLQGRRTTGKLLLLP